MTLAAHGVVGAAVGKNLRANLLAVFVLAFASHWVLDAIPHYDYWLSSYQRDFTNHLNDDMVLGVKFLHDLLFIGGDILLGLLVTWFLFRKRGHLIPANPLALLIGFVGAVLPDFLHFIQMKLKIEPFNSLQMIHDFFHTAINPRSGFWFANAIELIPIIIIILLINYLFHLWRPGTDT